MGCGAAQDHAVCASERESEIGDRKTPFEVALRVRCSLLQWSHVQGGVDDCTLLEDSVVIGPLPDKHLLGDPYLWGCKPHTGSRPHGVDHVGEELLEVIVKTRNRCCGGVKNRVAGDADRANGHGLDFSRVFREDSGVSRDTRETGNAAGWFFCNQVTMCSRTSQRRSHCLEESSAETRNRNRT